MSNRNSNAGTAADSSTPDEVTKSSQPIANAVLAAVSKYLKSQLGLIVLICCLVWLYNENVWSWKYWLSAISINLAYHYSVRQNSR